MKKLPRLLSLTVVVSCTPPEFEPPSHVDSVRILAIQADAPYAAPGQTVNLEMLAFDGRTNQAAPMKLGWLPEPCINPPADAYYACFAGLPGQVPQGVDLSSWVHEGSTFSFHMPEDVTTTHQGSDLPYGLSVLFSAACAGRLEYVPEAPGGSPDAVPFGCFGEGGQRLGSEAFIFAYSLVYSFATRQNHNPVIDVGGAARQSRRRQLARAAPPRSVKANRMAPGLQVGRAASSTQFQPLNAARVTPSSRRSDRRLD